MASVSAIVATRDRPQWVVEAVESIRAQTRPPDEIIVADDGDGSVAAELAARFGVRAICTNGQGPAAARDAAARLATGDWLAFCDDDDAWAPTRLEQELALADERTVLIYADAMRTDGRRELADRHPRSGHVFDALLLDNWIPTSTAMVRREAYLRAGGFPPRFAPAEDYHLWLTVARYGPLARVDEPLATYRIHDNQLQRRTAAMAGATADVIENALALNGWRPGRVPGLSARLRRLRFVQGRALARDGRGREARRAYMRAWRRQPHYLPALLFWVLSFLGI